MTNRSDTLLRNLRPAGWSAFTQKTKFPGLEWLQIILNRFYSDTYPRSSPEKMLEKRGDLTHKSDQNVRSITGLDEMDHWLK